MKIVLLQCDIAWNDAAANRAALQRQIESLGEVDLVVLPEMFPTGFCTHPRESAEPAEGPTFDWMRRMAAASEAAIAGSITVEQEGHYYNRFYFVRPDGTFDWYDKHHLFTYGGEHLELTGGARRTVVEFRGWRILLEVCYDLRFPVWSRNRGDYDMIIYVASWPSTRVAAWSALLRARAIENLCYVAGVNRVGDDPTCHYNGASALIDYVGTTLSELEPDRAGIIRAEIDHEALDEFRAKFPALQDADLFELKELS